MSSKPPSPNPKRVAAGKRNRLKRKGLSPEGRERLRQAALANRPWASSTGPRTPQGKARSARNGKLLQKGELSDREIRAELAEAAAILAASRRGWRPAQAEGPRGRRKAKPPRGPHDASVGAASETAAGRAGWPFPAWHHQRAPDTGRSCS
jgi:hypothetical protein